MSKQFKLLSEQVENLNNQIAMNNKKLLNLTSIKNQQSDDMGNEMFDSTNARSLDTSLLGSLHIAKKSMLAANEQLSNYEILEPNTSDIIGLGSTFEINMVYDDGFEDTETLTLVQIRNIGDSADYISIDSPLGKAVVGAEVGQEIEYMVEKRLFRGSITKIIKPKVKTL